MATPKISPAKLAAKLKKHTAKVRVDDLTDAIIREFGGMGEFAKQYVTDYNKAPAGSVTRGRLMAGALRLVEMVSKKDEGSAVEEMSDAELETEISEHLDRLLKATPIVDMTDAPPPTPTGGAPDGTPPLTPNS